MTGDPSIDYYLEQLQNVINELNDIKNGISVDIQGVGEQRKIAELDDVIGKFQNIKINIVNQYYNDINNK